jgi:chromosome segregation ATPase
MQSDFTSMQSDFTSMQSDLTSMKADLTGVKASVTDLQASVTALRGTMATRDDLTALRVAVWERFDRVEARINQVRDDVTVSMGRADRAHGAADSVRDDLRLLADEVATLTRKQRRLEARVDELTQPPGLAE